MEKKLNNLFFYNDSPKQMISIVKFLPDFCTPKLKPNLINHTYKCMILK